MNEPLPIIEPLVSGYKELNIGDFLKTKQFKRYCNKVGIADFWRQIFEHVENSRTFYSVGMDTVRWDSIDTFVILLNELFEKEKNNFFNFNLDFLTIYCDWDKEETDLSEIIEDLTILSAPNSILEKIKKLNHNGISPVPKTKISEYIWNAEKLELSINKMDDSIKNGEYNLTLTYAYSCLEGLFRAFIEKNIPEKTGETDLSKLSKIVKDYLKSDFDNNNIEYPEQMINLIGTITNAISNARNGFSESHFDRNSDKWLAEFSRDCVNSIGRLILKFME